MRDRWLVALCAAGTACFIACFAAAIAYYPGGTWFDSNAAGHSFAKNFLCDLMQTRALNGQDASSGARIASIGMIAMLAAIAAFYALIARFELPVSRAGRIARGAGLLACVLGCAVPLTPSDRFRNGHVAAVLCGFAPSLVATIAALVVCMRAPRVSIWLRSAALVTLVAGALDGLAYAFAYARYYASPQAAQSPLLNASLPALQRVATIGMVAWVLAVCVHANRARASTLPR